MDIYKIWRELPQNNVSTTIKKEEIMDAIHMESKSVVSQLKKGLGIKMKWILFFIVLFSFFMIWFYHQPQAAIIFAVMNALYIISYLKQRKFYNQMDHQVNPESTLLESFKFNESSIKSALRYEKNTMLIFIPVCVIGGLILPGIIKGMSIIELISNTQMVVVMIIALVLLIPAAYIIGNRMNQIAFGTHLQKLRKNISALEQMQ